MASFVMAFGIATSIIAMQAGFKQIDLARGPLSARPQLLGSELLLLHAAGTIARLNFADGKETASIDAGEPLGEVVTVYNNRLLVGGRDGVLHIVTPPQATP